ncbi:MAG: type II toxin-antitoxin system RelE/ParE family toxin [Pseudomonadales bacterium]
MIDKTKVFESTFKKANIKNDDLVAACGAMAKGLVDADLGDHLYKKRVAMPGQGKSGSYRTMIGAVIGDRYFFLYMFAKSDKSNINKREKLALKELAKEYVDFDQKAINNLINSGELIKVESVK